MSSYASRNALRFTSHATAATRSAAAVACDMNLKAFHDAYIHRIPMHYYNLGWERALAMDESGLGFHSIRPAGDSWPMDFMV